MQRPSENQLENCLALDGRTRWGGWTWSWESQNCSKGSSVTTHRETRVRWGGPGRSWNLHLDLNEDLLFRRTELALSEIKRMIGCLASLELRGQNTDCQIQEMKKEQNQTLSQAVFWVCNCSASDIQHFRCGGCMAAWVSSPRGSAVLREQHVCPALCTVHLALCAWFRF